MRQHPDGFTTRQIHKMKKLFENPKVHDEDEADRTQHTQYSYQQKPTEILWTNEQDRNQKVNPVQNKV